MADPVFVQPHFDDVALSCGGTVAELAAEGEPVIVTVFGGEPAGESSEFARFQHDRWNLSDAEAVQVRRGEDRAAAAVLGPAVSVIWLDYPDAIYRRTEYGSDEALFGAIVPEDRQLAADIAERLSSMGSLFVLPLAIGNHVDHQLAFRSGMALARSGYEVWFYADQPYAVERTAFESRLSSLGDPEWCTRAVSSGAFEQRWSAIERYRSQLPVIFRAIDDPRRQLATFGRPEGGQGPVELFWRADDIEEQRR